VGLVPPTPEVVNLQVSADGLTGDLRFQVVVRFGKINHK
jgi:hypothetical protein